MEKKRIGNDRYIKMVVSRKGRPESFENKTLTIEVWCNTYKTTIQDYIINDNTISFIWYGTEQKKCGKYFITLYERYGEKSQNVVDSRPFVELIPYSYDNHECGCEIDTTELYLSVDIDAENIILDYNNLVNLPSINGITLKGDLTLEQLGIRGEKRINKRLIKVLQDLTERVRILEEYIKECQCKQDFIYDESTHTLKVGIPVKYNYDAPTQTLAILEETNTDYNEDENSLTSKR